METFAKAGEKGLLCSMFGESPSSDDEGEATVFEGGVNKEEQEEDTDDDGGYSEVVHASISGEVSIRLLQQKRRGIAHQLWPAATHLCNYLEAHQDALLAPHGGLASTRILELGAGIGLVGLFLGALGCARVVVTDLPAAVDILRANIDLNAAAWSPGCVSAQALDWGSPQDLADCLAAVRAGDEPGCPDSPPLLVVVADCVYWECLFQSLADTLAALCAAGCTVLMSHVKRWKKDARFFKLCSRGGLAVEVLLETVEMVPADNTSLPEKTITRVYRITQAALPS